MNIEYSIEARFMQFVVEEEAHSFSFEALVDTDNLPEMGKCGFSNLEKVAEWEW